AATDKPNGPVMTTAKPGGDTASTASETTAGRAAVEVEPKPVTPAPAGTSDRLAARREVEQENAITQRGYEQMLGLIERIGRHLDQQSERSERMVNLLERLPAALESLPEIRQNSKTLVDAVTAHFRSQEVRDE